MGAATAFLKTGRQAEAEALLEKTLKGQDRSPQIHLMIGQAHLGLNQPELGCAVISELWLTLAPAQPDGHFYLGRGLFQAGTNSRRRSRSGASPPDWILTYFPPVFAVGALLAGQRNFDEARGMARRGPSRCVRTTGPPASNWEGSPTGSTSMKRLCPTCLEATRQQPELKEASYLLANTYRSLGSAEEARKEFLRHSQFAKERA